MINNRHLSLGLSDESVLNMYELMLKTRRFDEKMWLLHRSGKIPFVVSGQGQEAAQVGAAFALDRKKDYILPYYRDLGVVLAFGMTMREVALSNFGKAEDPNSGGRQMPGHYGQKKNRIVTGSSPVTTQVPHAVGIALGGSLEGKDFVTFTTFGEGSSNQGDFHEGLNFASVHKLPCIFMCQNNKYAISVPINKQLACENVSDRAIGYGMHGITVNGNDPLEVYAAIKDAVERGRRGEGPSLVETVCYRLTPHSSNDDDLAYRSREEVENARKNDPIRTFGEYLRSIDLLTDSVMEEMESKIEVLVDEAIEYAENAPYAEPATALDYVYGK
ncbi:thiamine pyrophosphate-dependent dehydrogenase E1 component subunit alpha [Bacillus subtilis]|uniref:2-oxoisovalerate dehydrogenase subunit alpha n=1 Tax=Bacillus subtilis TaxID=1423 RepID=A0A8I1WEM0_BACIU|nr:thiamine pyrophosphate-dependent dehydrogenase E1 component subunit alpha [Bacillus subtilis]MBO3795581.1 thiamine pyrophosphate-dependent dehydrogenase E1 component subunit alpha [Bacillus subtilis]